MKRLARSRSGKQMYGQKWQSIELNESDDDAQLPSESIEIAGVSTGSVLLEQDPHFRNGNPLNGRSMYKAALKDDWAAAALLLEQDPNLAREAINERGDRALHVAAAFKHKDFVKNLVEVMSEDDLALLDGRGYTACCYAALSGAVEVAEAMIQNNTKLITARDGNNQTPLYKAALSGNGKMVLHFLRLVGVEDLSTDEWFHLLLTAVGAKLYDVALEILGKDASLATGTNEEGTILHLLARQDTLHFRTTQGVVGSYGYRVADIKGLPRKKVVDKMQPGARLLAEKLWVEIEALGEAKAVELLKNPPILQDAAKMGNVELITMVTQTYPDLMWESDGHGYTIFHHAVIHRHENVFRLIHTAGAMKHLVAISQDQNGDNILHLAGRLAPPKNVSIPAFHMQRELAWFKEVETIAPPWCQQTRNNERRTPKELFSWEHKRLVEKSEAWMRNAADSCMLIATIMLTVVFTAAFTVPGGNDQNTGIPILLKKNWFTCFVIFEALAMFGSTLSIVVFWSIMTSSFQEGQFLHALPKQLKIGLAALLMSLVGSVSAFVSAYFLAFVGVNTWLVEMVIISVYASVLGAIGVEFVKLMLSSNLQRLFSDLVPHGNVLSLFSTWFCNWR